MEVLVSRSAVEELKKLDVDQALVQRILETAEEPPPRLGLGDDYLVFDVRHGNVDYRVLARDEVDTESGATRRVLLKVVASEDTDLPPAQEASVQMLAQAAMEVARRLKTEAIDPERPQVRAKG